MQTEVGLLDLLLVPVSLCDRPMRGSIQRFVRPVASLTLMGSALELVELIICLICSLFSLELDKAEGWNGRVRALITAE